MEAKEVKSLQEAYASIYSDEYSQEYVINETAMKEDPRMQGRKNPSPGDGKKSRPLPTPSGPRKEMNQLPRRTPENAKNVEYYKDDVDLFDIVKGHLMSEGYADTEEAALAIMANMSEEWRNEIVESSCGGGHSKPKKKKKSGY